jgi:hypothetical protein
MYVADEALETDKSADEVIDRLSFTIQRQSAMCFEFVKSSVAAEREQCASLAEDEASQAHGPARMMALRIAEKIRARDSQTLLLSNATMRAGG